MLNFLTPLFTLFLLSGVPVQDQDGHHHDKDGHNHAKEPNKVYWSATRKLTWSDYGGKWNDKRQVEVFSLISSFYNHFTSKGGDSLLVETMPVFYPDDSYVKPERKTAGQLSHEQSKFDLYEVWARKLRRDFATAVIKKANYSSSMQSIYTTNLKARNLELGKYKEETKDGKDPVKQKEWAGKISKQLLELNKYSKTTVSVILK